jgi:hypothetical protein
VLRRDLTAPSGNLPDQPVRPLQAGNDQKRHQVSSKACAVVRSHNTLSTPRRLRAAVTKEVALSSRNIIPALDPDLTVVVGWDNPMRTFFAQVDRRQQLDDPRGTSS